MTPEKRRVGLLILVESVLTIAVVVTVASRWPIRALVFVAAMVVVVLVQRRKDVTGLIHRITGH